MLGLRLRRWCVVGFATALVGCGGLDLGSEDGDGNGGDGDSGGSDTDSFGATDTDGSGDDATGGSNGDDAGTDDPDCGEYYCGGVGTCVDDQGTPYCECDEGYALLGNTCVECTAIAASDFEVAIEMATFQGRVLLDGKLAQTSLSDRGRVVAVNTRTADRVVLTDTRNGNFDVGIVPGVYDLYYELVAGGVQVPRNEHAYLETISILADVGRHDINLTPIQIGGPILLNGATPTSSFSNRGDLFLEDPITGDRARIGSTGDGQYAGTVLAGTYDVYYELTAGGTSVPRNTHGLVTSGLDVQAGLSDPIEITMHSLSGAITVNNATPTTSNFDDARLTLRSADGRDEFVVGNTHDGTYAANVMPGSYQVVYSLESGGITVPRNRAAKVDDVTVAGDATEDIDIEMVTVSGGITLNGATPSTSFFDDGRLWLRSFDGRDEAQLGLTSDGSYSAPVIPGSYELRYGVESAGPTVPRNTNAFLRMVDVATTPQQDIDIEAVAIDGGITVAGSVPPSSIYQTARIVLRSPDRVDRLELAKTHEGSYQARVIPGTYDVVYVEDGATTLPGNRNGDVLEGLQLSSDMTVAINVPVVTLSGSVTLDGGTPPSSSSDVGSIVLERRNDDDGVVVTKTTNATFSSDVVPGTYDVFYEVEQSAGGVPSNERARLSCVDIQP